MSVLKDVECYCGARQEIPVSQGETRVKVFCPVCGGPRWHQTICNGGTKCRVFVTETDLACRKWSDEEVRAGTCGVDCDGKPVEDLSTGQRVQDDPRFGADAVGSRRDELNHEHDRKTGRTPIVMDMGR